jgi:hypothetical protein
LLKPEDLASFIAELVGQLSKQQGLNDRMIRAIIHSQIGDVSDDQLRELVLENRRLRDDLEKVATNMTLKMAEALLERRSK